MTRTDTVGRRLEEQARIAMSVYVIVFPQEENEASPNPFVFPDHYFEKLGHGYTPLVLSISAAQLELRGFFFGFFAQTFSFPFSKARH